MTSPDRTNRALAWAHEQRSVNATRDAGMERLLADEVERLRAREAELVKALERIGWHELAWKEARDVARAALAGSPDTPAEQDAGE